jgi:hypothetical protein
METHINMNDPIMDSAYTIAREQYHVARLAAFAKLKERFPDAGLDSTHHAVERGMKLFLSALSFAEKVWAGSLPDGKASEYLRSQFSDFSEATVDRAFSEACRDTR